MRFTFPNDMLKFCDLNLKIIRFMKQNLQNIENFKVL